MSPKTIFYGLAIVLTLCNRLAFARHEVPDQFGDDHLPEDRRRGLEVELLGRVNLLPGLDAVKSVEHLTTRFTIHTRRRAPLTAQFNPGLSYAHQTNRSVHIPYELDWLYEGGFNISRKTVVLIPGFMSKDFVRWISEAKDKWLKLEDINLIHVSWSDNNQYFYASAVAHTPLIARQITILLYYLAAVKGVDFRSDEFTKSVHFVGHSLGAHISAFVGQDFGGRLGRITALDPAGPTFDKFGPEFRLDRGDARFVDVIHTNAGVMNKLNLVASSAVKAANFVCENVPVMRQLAESIKCEYSGEGDTAWFGLDAQVGHVDYYANSGKTQPGCSDVYHICDHGRAHDLLTDILEHELSLRRIGYSAEQRKLSRLVAFPAANYETFLSGANFQVACPKLMQVGEHLSERAIATLSACSIPIDLLTPVHELMDEMRSKHGVPLDSRADSAQSPGMKYYFKTLPAEAFVGDHYLLKLYLTDEPIWDETQCSLEATIDMDDEYSIEINMERIAKDASGSYFRTIAMPFIQPLGLASRALINGLEAGDTNSSISRETLEEFKRIVLPNKLTITIGNVKAKGMMQTVKNTLARMWQASSRDCALSIGMIEVHPVVQWRRNFGGIYGFEAAETDGRPLPVYPMEQQARVPWLDERISRLKSDSVMITSRKLVALVVGE